MSVKCQKITWDAYHQLIDALVHQLAINPWAFDCVLGIARGGLRIADIISRVFNKPMAVIITSSYREDQGKVQGNLAIAPVITAISGSLQGKVLIVDDMVDSGNTLSAVSQQILQYSGITESKTAVLWWKSQSGFSPDYHVERFSHEVWIEQPFERYDKLTAQDFKH